MDPLSTTRRSQIIPFSRLALQQRSEILLPGATAPSMEESAILHNYLSGNDLPQRATPKEMMAALKWCLANGQVQLLARLLADYPHLQLPVMLHEFPLDQCDQVLGELAHWQVPCQVIVKFPDPQQQPSATQGAEGVMECLTKYLSSPDCRASAIGFGALKTPVDTAQLLEALSASKSLKGIAIQGCGQHLPFLVALQAAAANVGIASLRGQPTTQDEIGLLARLVDKRQLSKLELAGTGQILALLLHSLAMSEPPCKLEELILQTVGPMPKAELEAVAAALEKFAKGRHSVRRLLLPVEVVFEPGSYRTNEHLGAVLCCSDVFQSVRVGNPRATPEDAPLMWGYWKRFTQGVQLTATCNAVQQAFRFGAGYQRGAVLAWAESLVNPPIEYTTLPSGAIEKKFVRVPLPRDIADRIVWEVLKHKSLTVREIQALAVASRRIAAWAARHSIAQAILQCARYEKTPMTGARIRAIFSAMAISVDDFDKAVKLLPAQDQERALQLRRLALGSEGTIEPTEEYLQYTFALSQDEEKMWSDQISICQAQLNQAEEQARDPNATQAQKANAADMALRASAKLSSAQNALALSEQKYQQIVEFQLRRISPHYMYTNDLVFKSDVDLVAQLLQPGPEPESPDEHFDDRVVEMDEDPVADMTPAGLLQPGNVMVDKQTGIPEVVLDAPPKPDRQPDEPPPKKQKKT